MADGKVCDVVLVGAGIMSATLAMLLKKLEPALTVRIFERLDSAAAESSDAWNNAGTGHSGFCELNYTPQSADGAVDCGKAIKIAEQFELSRQFWARLIEAGDLPDRASFVRLVPHLAFVSGAADVGYLKARHDTLTRSPLFEGMEYSQDPARLATWMPLVMEGRPRDEAVAATCYPGGTDVNFGALTRALIASLQKQEGVTVHFAHEVGEIRRDGPAWRLDVKDHTSGDEQTVDARFLFIGAGGYSLALLERTGIPEARGYGAFPVSGQWLRCTNREVITRHHAKVYGKAEVGAPPMSVPHLDTRWIDGEQQLLFGTYAGFTTKFLKQGSWLDLLASIGIDNVLPVMNAGLANFDLTRYLLGQAMLSSEARLQLLHKYCPQARSEDWEVQVAGLRVQIIKGDGRGRGELKFGTEVVTSHDGSVAALLGASPGASTAVGIMLELLERCFPAAWKSAAWQARLREWVPSVGRSLHRDTALCRSVRTFWSTSLTA